MPPQNTPIFLSISLLLLLSLPSNVECVGVNWGTAASHPLPPEKVVQLLKANSIGKVKLFDADPLVLQSLSGSKIRVTVGIPNSMLRSLNASLKAAESWVHDNLTRFVSDGASRVLIELKKCGDSCLSFLDEHCFDSNRDLSYVAVGDEPFLQSYGDQFYPFVVGAAANIQIALLKANLAQKVKVVGTCSFDAIVSETGLPSKARFRPDVNKTMIQLLTFLNRHTSPLFISITPFQSHLDNKNITLDLSLFRETARARNDTHKTYKNSFDLSYDTIVSALSSAGFPQTEIVIGRIGWPTDGAPNATSSLAQEFTKGLINHLQSKASKSSKSQDIPTQVYIFSLVDEDKRSVATGSFERHWGVFTFDGQAKYQVDLGQGLRKLVDAQGVQYLSSKWCVVNNNKDLSNATAQASEACAAADCSALSQDGSCFNLSWPGNISYAFNSYYQQHNQNADSCGFGGLGLITTVDPSVDRCRFSVGLKTSFSVSLKESAPFGWFVSPVVSVLLWLLTLTW